MVHPDQFINSKYFDVLYFYIFQNFLLLAVKITDKTQSMK